MKNNIFIKTYATFSVIAIVLMAGIFVSVPAPVRAFDPAQIIDPFCLFACDDDPEQVTNNYTNSNNVNSNINSPGAVVNDSGNSAPAYSGGDYAYNYPQYPRFPSLQVSCYPNQTSADIDESVNWRASASGGNGSYYYTWSGTEGLSGYGSSINIRYYYTGLKSASVSVTSGDQTVTRSCGESVRVYDNDGRYYDDRDDDYYGSLRVTCTADEDDARIGDIVRWTARASGGSGNYSYRWDGDEGLSGTGRSVTIRYDRTGDKDAEVTVRSGGRSITRACDDTVRVRGSSYDDGNRYDSYSYDDRNGGLDVACFADPSSARVNQPVTWKAEVTGGYSPYSYSWTGTDGLGGNDNGVLKYYGSVGDKSAVVTVKSADGRTSTAACSNSVSIRSASTGNGGTTGTPAPKQPAEEDDAGLSAAALFSLKNVPWGWVAILVILVLFATVAYLLFNRPKI